MTASDDPACIAALAAQIGHAAPFTDQEIAGVRSLTIKHARDLSPIARCIGLEHLRIVACELEDLLALEALQSVKHLEIHATRLNSILGLTAEKLERVDVLFSSIHDASDLSGAPRGWQGTVIGNPLKLTSRGILTELFDNGWALVDIGSRYDWEECCKLWERLGACSGELAGDYGLIVRPGIPTLTKNSYDAIQVGTGTAVSELDDPDMTLEKIFATYAHRIEAPDLSEIAATRSLGRTKHAKQWIAESALSSADKAAVDSFVSGFPDMVFYRVTNAANDRKQKAFKLRLPDHYRRIRETLDGWWPLGRIAPPVGFDRFEDSSPRADRVKNYTYYLGLRGHGADEQAAMLKAGFAIVGWSKEQPISVLAIRLDEDPAIYEYSPEDILDAISEDRDVSTSVYRVFDSYAAMLGHVTSIHLPNEIVVEKTR